MTTWKTTGGNGVGTLGMNVITAQTDSYAAGGKISLPWGFTPVAIVGSANNADGSVSSLHCSITKDGVISVSSDGDDTSITKVTVLIFGQPTSTY